ncbi:HD-GYP domain-containing protein [Phosphitispora sp. TUW77]|uniref:HD-GYP domain-containing protein n=1 Tax=Phosphitispora sp. TUW77 TaxID=3152361 RepID=UPI003AB207A6
MEYFDFDYLEFRLYIKTFSFIIALLLTKMTLIEWRRFKNSMYKYLTLGFGTMILQISFVIITIIYSLFSDTSYYNSITPVVDHALRTLSYIFVAASFVTQKPVHRSKFVLANLAILIFFTPVMGILWTHNSTVTQPPFMGPVEETFFELWNTILLIFTVRVISLSDVYIKQGLIISTSVLVAKQILHFINIYWLHDRLALSLAAEPALLILYFYLIISTIHKEIIGNITQADKEKVLVKEKAYQDIIRALITSLEAKDKYTRGHSDRVTEYAMIIGKKLGLTAEELTKLYCGAILHDIGKIGIDEGILNNPMSLGDDEITRIKKHPEIGAQIISSIDSLSDIAPAVLYHHERFDGTGYPLGLKNNEIPLHARIIAISDAFDAMSSTRSYRDQVSKETAIKEIISGAGTQFDPDLVMLLAEALGFSIGNNKTVSQVLIS